MKATFVKFTSTGKTAIAMVKANKFALGAGFPVYMHGDSVREELGDTPAKGDSFSIPDTTEFMQMTWIDQETDEVIKATTKPDADGNTVPLMTIAS